VQRHGSASGARADGPAGIGALAGKMTARFDTAGARTKGYGPRHVPGVRPRKVPHEREAAGPWTFPGGQAPAGDSAAGRTLDVADGLRGPAAGRVLRRTRAAAGAGEDDDRPRGERAFPDPGGDPAQRAGRPRRPRPSADRFRQDAGFRACTAHPDGRPAGGVEAAARAGPGADPGACTAGERRAGAVRADAERATGDGGRRPVDQPAVGAAAKWRRGGRRDAGAAGRPGVAAGLPPASCADHGAGRGGPDVRLGVFRPRSTATSTSWYGATFTTRFSHRSTG
jgi:hypothetical protein